MLPGVVAVAVSGGGLLPTRLRVEHRPGGNGALCTDAPRPRFSWDLPSPAGWRGVEQMGYHLTVGSWASGWVPSDTSILVPYGGPPLQPHAAVAWSVRVRVANATGVAMESGAGVGSFRTAYGAGGADAELGAQWISPVGNQLRAEFPLPGGEVRSAALYVAAPGYARAFVNGGDVGGDLALGPWTTWSKRVLYHCHDVTVSVRAGGANAVGLWLGNGQYRGKWSRAWSHAQPPLALALQLRVAFADGRVATFGTLNVSSWRQSGSGPVRADDVYAGEEFDARRLTPGWAEPGLPAAAAWTPVPALDRSSVLWNASLSAHAFTPIRAETQGTPALNVTRLAPETYLFFFPANVAGVVQLNAARAPANTTISLAHGAQLLDSHGKPCLVACAGSGRGVYYPFGGARDRYTFRGDPAGETWRPSFTYHGYQFVQLDGWPAQLPPPTTATLTQHPVRSDNAPTAWPSFSAGLLSRIHSNIVASLRNNMHSVESDCPTRERVGWTGKLLPRTFALALLTTLCQVTRRPPPKRRFELWMWRAFTPSGSRT